MNTNYMDSLTFIVFLMLAISVVMDLKRRRQEKAFNSHIGREYKLELTNQNKANWHKGFQMALGTVLFFLLMAWANEFGWLDGGGIIEPDAPSNPNG
jgi:hypothetical protein